ncbi:Tkl protein kinase, partial [Globisporangium splendens]
MGVHAACRSGDAEEVSAVLRRSNVSVAEHGHVDVVRILLEIGADVNVCDRVGAAPLHFADQRGYAEAVTLLLHYAANADVASSCGATALHHAAHNGQAGVVEVLIENAANVDVADSSDSSPLRYAARYGNKNVVDALIRSNATEDPLDSNGGLRSTMHQVIMLIFQLAKLKVCTRLAPSTGREETDYNWTQQIAIRDLDVAMLREEIRVLQHQVGSKAKENGAATIFRSDEEKLNRSWSLIRMRKTRLRSTSIHQLKYNRDISIGVGSFGEVYKATWLETSVVTKFMGYAEDGDKCRREMFFLELRVRYQLNHPHAIKLFGACHAGKRIALGLKYLHEQNIVHNDLKCDNILVGASGESKITDLGLSCIPNIAEVKMESKKIGALQRRSSEFLRGDRVTFTSDIDSFAMCILEAHLEYMEDFQSALIKMMCASDPSKRITISTVVDKSQELSRGSSS